MKTYKCFYLDWADKEIALDRLSVRGRPSICSSIEQFAVTIANQKSCYSFLTKQPPMRVSQSNAANKRGQLAYSPTSIYQWSDLSKEQSKV